LIIGKPKTIVGFLSFFSVSLPFQLESLEEGTYRERSLSLCYWFNIYISNLYSFVFLRFCYWYILIL